jgi:large subunit ribosomal protein L24
MAKLNIKKGDTVLVITGKDSNKTAEVLECFPAENKVTVKGINVLVKHNKPRSAQDKGGIVKVEGKIPASNVMVVCPTCNKATRVAIKVDEKGNKVRVCKKCGATLDAAKKATAKKATKTAEVKAEEKPVAKKATTKTTAKKAEVKETKNTAKAEKAPAAKKPAAKKATAKKEEK